MAGLRAGAANFRVEGEVVNMDINMLLRNEIPNREEKANWLSKLTFWYLNGLVLLGWQRPLQQVDIDAPHTELRSARAYEDFRKHWQAELTQPEPSLFRALYSTTAAKWWLGMIAFAFYIALSFLPPLMLGVIVGYLEGSRSLNDFQRFGIAASVFVVPLLASVFYNYHGQLTAHVGYKARAAVSHAIFRKSLTLSNSARAKSTVGHIVNLMSTDAQQLQAVTAFLNLMWSSPIQIAIALWLLHQQVGEAMFVGFGCMALLVPLNKMAVGRVTKMRQQLLKLVDRRVKVINELLLSIRVVKMYAWERAMRGRVMEVREEELAILKRILTVIAVGLILVMTTAPLIMPILVFITYTKTGHTLTASTAFTTVALFQVVRAPLAFLPMVLQQVANSKVSMRRIRNFLLSEELKHGVITPPPNDEDAVHLNGLTATWGVPKPSPIEPDHASKRGKRLRSDKQNDAKSRVALLSKSERKLGNDEPSNRKPVLELASIEHNHANAKSDQNGAVGPALGQHCNPAPIVSAAETDNAAQLFRLQDCDLRVRKGQLIAVVGPLGSGKSTLLAVLLNELQVQQGSVHVRGTMAYAAQQPWILNCSLRDNIRFDLGSELHEDRYQKLLHACALEPDLAQLKDGDRTEIGERGINLSGGQKARVAVARAVYNEADIYLFDDILSAVDQHVAEHMFREVLLGLLAGKTRILVTNQLQFLSQCDLVVVLEQGRIVQQGTFADIMASGLDFARMVHRHGLNQSAEEPSAITMPQEGTGNTADISSESNQDSDSNKASDAVVEDEIKVEARSRIDGSGAATPKPVSSISLGDLRSSPSLPEDATARSGDATLIPQDSVDSKSDDAATPTALVVRPNCAPSGNGFEVNHTVAILPAITASTEQHIDGNHKPSAAAAKTGEAAKLISAEERAEGEVPWSAYMYYFRSGGPIFILVLFAFAGTEACRLALDFWLASWATHKQGALDSDETDYYIGVYGAFGAATLVVVFARAWGFSTGRIRISRAIMAQAFDRVIRAPMRFFDTTPVGRVLNRFSRDQDAVDQMMGQAVTQTLYNSFQVLSTAVAISTASKGVLLLALVPLIGIYMMIQRFFRRTSTELQRLESISRSPIFAHFSETLTGASTIRAYAAEERFYLRNQQLLDINTRTGMLYTIVFNWLALRLDVLGSALGLTVALVAVSAPNFFDPGWAALALAYAFSVTDLLKNMVRMSSELESRMNCVERLKHYAEQLPQEAPAEVPDHKPADSWPSKGAITVRDLTVSYKKGTPVLKGVSLAIQPGEKIGVAGRTGSGKSTFMLSLLRILEADEGSISIDGIDVATIGLNDLRGRVAIIPQEPVLFSVSLRLNIDPWRQCTDAEVWRVLEMVQIRDFVAGLPGGLDFVVAENGENLSVGQRQMVCMARALLRKPKVLLLDEATASIDVESDYQVQLVLRTCFADATVITVAHRLKTIMDYDRIALFDNGHLLEFDRPRVLLQNPKGLLTQFVNAHGPSYAKTLHQLASGELDIAAVKNVKE